MRKIIFILMLIPILGITQISPDFTVQVINSKTLVSNQLHVKLRSNVGYGFSDISTGDVYAVKSGANIVRYSVVSKTTSGVFPGFDGVLTMTPLDGYGGVIPTATPTASGYIYRPIGNGSAGGDLAPLDYLNQNYLNWAMVNWNLQSIKDSIRNGTIDTLYDYTAFRAANSQAKFVLITKNGINGLFKRSQSNTTDDGGIYIQDAGGEDWERIYNREKSIEWYGALGDGTSDDLLPIQAALNAGGIIITEPGKYYLISNTITIPKETFLHMADKSFIKVSGTFLDTAVIVNTGWAGTQHEVNFSQKIYVIRDGESWYSGGDNTSIGILINANADTHFDIAAHNFCVGVKLLGKNTDTGLGGGVVGCKFNIREISNCRTGIEFDDNAGIGWINSNSFTGGHIFMGSSYVPPTPTFTTYAINANSPTTLANDNSFIDILMEGANYDTTLFLSGPGNLVMGCRFENSVQAVAIRDGMTANNFISNYNLYDVAADTVKIKAMGSLGGVMPYTYIGEGMLDANYVVKGRSKSSSDNTDAISSKGFYGLKTGSITGKGEYNSYKQTSGSSGYMTGVSTYPAIIVSGVDSTIYMGNGTVDSKTNSSAVRLKYSASNFRIATNNGANVFSFLNNGYFGVGVTTPTQAAQIEYTSNSSNGVYVRNYSTGTSAAAALSLVNSAGNTLTFDVRSPLHSVFPLSGVISSPSALTGGIVVYQSGANPINMYTNGTSRFFISGTGGVGINTASPNASALLDLTSTTKGLLIPRATITQINAMPTPATGLLVYGTTLNKFRFYNGSSWLALVDSTVLAGYLPLAGGTMTGHLLFTDNTYDIGASGLTRPRTGYFGTSVVAPTLVPTNITGTTTNNNASAGSVGEYPSSAVADASAISLTTATPINVDTLILTAGDWDVDANVNFVESASTVTARAAAITLTSATLPTDGTKCSLDIPTTISTGTVSITLKTTRISIAGTTNVYLAVSSDFSAGSQKAGCSFSARRVR